MIVINEFVDDVIFQKRIDLFCERNLVDKLENETSLNILE